MAISTQITVICAKIHYHKIGLQCPNGVVYIVVSSPSATEDIGAMGLEIESRQGIGW
jgi:hypothetical protein